MQQLDYLQRRLVHPAERVQQKIQDLNQLQKRLKNAFSQTAQNQSWHWLTLQQKLRASKPDLTTPYNRHIESGRRLKDAMRLIIERNDNRLLAAQHHLLHLDPQQVLARGYSMVRNALGEVVRDSDKLILGEALQINFAHGAAQVEVKDKSATS